MASTTIAYLRLRLREGAEFNPMLLLDFLKRARTAVVADTGARLCSVYQGVDVGFEMDEDVTSSIDSDDDDNSTAASNDVNDDTEDGHAGHGDVVDDNTDLLEALQDDPHRDFYLLFTTTHSTLSNVTMLHRDITQPPTTTASTTTGGSGSWDSVRPLLNRLFHIGRRCNGDVLGGGLLSINTATTEGGGGSDCDTILNAAFASLEHFTATNTSSNTGDSVLPPRKDTPSLVSSPSPAAADDSGDDRTPMHHSGRDPKPAKHDGARQNGTGVLTRLSAWSTSIVARNSDLGSQPIPSRSTTTTSSGGGGHDRLKLVAVRLLERNRYI